MKVRALRTGWAPDHVNINGEHLLNPMRRRGDDTLGEGNGDVFELLDYMVSNIDPKTQRTRRNEDGTEQPAMILLPAEKQFSERWMIRVDEDAPAQKTGAPDALARQTTALRRERGRK